MKAGEAAPSFMIPAGQGFDIANEIVDLDALQSEISALRLPINLVITIGGAEWSSRGEFFSETSQ
jgi:hypothetical protein